MERKMEILKAAVRLFSEKGYFSTSVQEIADECGISKGTLYKFFESKEALLIHVIEQSHQKMLQSAMNVNLEASLSPKEKFIKKLVVQFEGFIENKDFITMLMRTLPPQNNPQIPWLIKRIRITMLNWYKDCITETYGKKVEAFSWDVSLMFQGVIREYISLAIYENKDIDFEYVARFVVEQFEALIENKANLPPVLTSREMMEYEAFESEMEPETPQEQIQKLMDTLQRTIQQRAPFHKRKELEEALNCLQAEMNEQIPRRFFVQSLLMYLADVEVCEPLVRRLEAVLRTLKYD